MDNNNNANVTSSSDTKASMPGCLGIFIALFLIVWAVMFVGLGINFVMTMITAHNIQEECLQKGNCPQLQVRDGKGGTTTITPVIPHKK